MKNNLFRSAIYVLSGVLMALGFAACKPKQEPIITPPSEEAVRETPSMVIYECNERLFADKEAFRTIEAYVPELEKMGVNVLWLMPIHPRGADGKSIGSPYCVKDYRAIDPAFGTLDDLKHLVNTCHQHGMSVILDWIANHTAWDNAWVTAHPDWYEGPSTASEQDWKDVTFLNYNLQAVRDTMTDCMLYWVRNADIDGFRCDYANGVPLTWWQTTNDAIRQLKPQAILLAETSDTRHYDAGFSLLYSWSFLGALEDLYSGTGRWNALVSNHQSEYASTPINCERLRYITNHDEALEKAPISVYKDAAGELSAFCLTVFMGGVPMIYSSQEIGYVATIDFFQYNVLDFQSPNDTRDALSNIMRVWRETKDLRGGQQALGSLAARVPYIEYTKDDQVLFVLCNTSNVEQEVKMPMRYEGASFTNRLTNKTETPETVIRLQPREYRIYTK